MIRFITHYFSLSDHRGAINGLINFGQWEEMNYISSNKGTIRGGHYHQYTHEVFIILSGCVEVSVQRIVDGQRKDEMTSYRVTSGSVFMIEPMVYHVFKMEEDAEWINVLSKRMKQDELDIYT